MASSAKIGLLFAIPWIGMFAATAEEPAAKPQSQVEFRWLEDKPIAGVTDEKGISISETGELSYPHKKPILTKEDITEVRVTKTTFNQSTGLRDQYTLSFHLTKSARKKLADTCGESGDKMLTAVIDGKHLGTPYYLKSRDEANFVPYAGFFSSKEQVERIVASFK